MKKLAPSPNLFISDYEEHKKLGDNLIKEWRLKGVYTAKFYQVMSVSEITYRLEVHHNGTRDHVTLHKLPTLMIYMAYYFEEVVHVKTHGSESINYVSLGRLDNMTAFLRRMEKLEE